jgi:transmembrane sensor
LAEGKTTRQDEAAAWFAARRAGAMLAEDRAAFDAWHADPRNQAALNAMHELWGELAILKDAKSVRKAVRPRRVRTIAAAALLLASVGAAGIAWVALARDTTIHTAAGEQQTRSLPDGSVIAVNVASNVSYRLSEGRRLVRLDDGEAAFSVKSDPQRPFIVRTGGYDVRATGTAFNVRERNGSIEVSVSQGRVEICSAMDGNRLAILGAGQFLRLPAAPLEGAKQSLTPTAIPAAQISEWRMRVVTYEDAPVREVVADFNRYFERKLRVDEAGLADQRVTVRLQVDDRDRAIETLANLLNVHVQTTARGETLAR